MNMDWGRPTRKSAMRPSEESSVFVDDSPIGNADGMLATLAEIRELPEIASVDDLDEGEDS